MSQLINVIRTELAVQEGNKLEILSKVHTISFAYKVPLCLIAVYSFCSKIFVCVSIHFVLSLYLCAIDKFIFISRRLYSELQLYNNVILYKYIPANTSGHTVKGESCNSLNSEIAGSNLADVMALLSCALFCVV